jgi:phage shock protein PspC (stress-responsive transcriptional regulator)/predicted membrane protein
MVDGRRAVHAGAMTATAPPPPPAPTPPQPPNPPHRRLRRDRSNRLLGGVASGMARTYGIDVTLVRVLWVVAAVAWIGIPAYVIAWIAIPPDNGTVGDDLADRPRDLGLMAGLALVGVGVLIAANQIIPDGFRAHRFFAPVLLIGGGIAILVLRRPQADDDPADGAPVELENRVSHAHLEETVPATETAWTQTQPWAAPPAGKPPKPPRVRRPRPRPFLTPIALSLLMIGAGITSLLVATDTITLNLTIAFAVATGFVGLVLLLSTWVGRARGLIFVGVLLAFATAVSSAVNVPITGGIGEERYRPLTVSQIPERYELGIGHLMIDLEDVPYANRKVTVNAQLGIGEMSIAVPSTVRVVVNGEVGAGLIQIWGYQEDGWREESSHAAPGDGTGELVINARVGVGQILVRRFEPDGTETLLGPDRFNRGRFGGRP